MNTMKQRLFTNWHLMRILRLGIGIWLLIAGIIMKDWAAGFFSVFFLYQAVTDTGCCSASGCSPMVNKTGKKVTDVPETEYEEIK
ncbi:MAG: hypothetical protein K0Q79_1986 [Flavipsychrobacter sp.]|nr:hypothetical protein [Flavipsychrobacter sp.]